MAVSTISGAIKWTGLASDTDFGSVVRQLVAIEQRTITRQETWKSEWLKKLNAINGLDTRLSALKLDAQSYDARAKLLSRAAASSDEKVVTMTNLSTAPTGVYEVEVGSNIQEKIASGSYQANKSIGLDLSKVKVGVGGAIVDANNRYVLKPGLVAYDPEAPDAEYDYHHLDLFGYPQDEDNNNLPELLCYINQAGHLVNYNEDYNERRPVLKDGLVEDSGGALMGLSPEGRTLLLDAEGKVVLLPGLSRGDYDFLPSGLPFDIDNGMLWGIMCYADDNGYPVDRDGNIIHDYLEPLPKGAVPPITITMGGKTLSLEYDPEAKAGDPGVYNSVFTLDDLARSINATVEAEGYKGPKVSAEVIFDKTRSGEIFSRLVITGGEGGSANHITISDPTNLGLGQKRFDEPMTASLAMSSARLKIAAGSAYTGHSNKTITFVPTTTGVLGENDITFSWADTEGNRGTFTLKASDWDPVNGRMKDDVPILQGLRLNFSAGMFAANDGFTIDCQAPVLQQAADSGMAATDKWIHRGWSDQTTPVTRGAAGRFDFSYAGESFSVPIADGLGLSGLADAINNYSKNPGVIASVINDGLGTATSYKLVLTGAHTGVEHGIEILGTTSLNQMDCSPATFEHARWASNSMTRFDGYPNDGVSWLQRATNEVGDVIEGTVVNLMGVGKATITIKNNVTEMANKIKALVESVNMTKNFIKDQTKWGGGKLVSNVLADGTIERSTEGGEENGIMIGNYGFQISLSELDKLMTRAIFTVDEYIEARIPDAPERAKLSRQEKQALYDKYLEDNGLLYTRLSDIGIASNQNQGGLYVIEESKLMECLSKNPEAVIKLFTFNNGENDFPVDNTVVAHLDEAARPRLSGFAVQLGFRMSDLTRPNDVIDPATGLVAKSAKGITKVLADNYSSIISGSDGKGGIDAKIAREKKRIELYQQRLEQKFARLETALAQLNSNAERVSSQIAQLNNNSSK